MKRDTIVNALRNTKVVIPPRLALATFGSSSFNYTLLTQNMDDPNVQYIRQGKVHADQPRLINPFRDIKLGGDHEPNGKGFTEMLNQYAPQARVFLNGLNIDLTHITKATNHGNYQAMLDFLHKDITKNQYDQPMLALITGIEDCWSVSLQKAVLEIGYTSAWEQIKDLIDLGQVD